MNIEKFVTDYKYNTNTYLVICPHENEALVIDPSDHCEQLIDYIDLNSIRLKYLINTHAHPDHCSGNYMLYEKYKPIIMLSRLERHLFRRLQTTGFINKKKLPLFFISEGDTLKFGAEKAIILETPGHTNGSVSVLAHNSVFVGDLIINGLERELDPVSKSTLQKKILNLPYQQQLMIYPGHGLPLTIEETQKMVGWYRKTV